MAHVIQSGTVILAEDEEGGIEEVIDIEEVASFEGEDMADAQAAVIAAAVGLTVRMGDQVMWVSSLAPGAEVRAVWVDFIEE